VWKIERRTRGRRINASKRGYNEKLNWAGQRRAKLVVQKKVTQDRKKRAARSMSRKRRGGYFACAGIEMHGGTRGKNGH